MDFGSHIDKKQSETAKKPEERTEEAHQSIQKPDTFPDFFDGEPPRTVIDEDAPPLDSQKDDAEHPFRPELLDDQSNEAEEIPVIQQPEIKPGPQQTQAVIEKRKPQADRQQPASRSPQPQDQKPSVDCGKLPSESRLAKLLQAENQSPHCLLTRANLHLVLDGMETAYYDWQPWILYRRDQEGSLGLKVAATKKSDPEILRPEVTKVMESALGIMPDVVEWMVVSEAELKKLTAINLSARTFIKNILDQKFAAATEIKESMRAIAATGFYASTHAITIHRHYGRVERYAIDQETFSYLKNTLQDAAATNGQMILMECEPFAQAETPLPVLIEQMDAQSAAILTKMTTKNSGVVVVAGTRNTNTLETAVSLAGAVRAQNTLAGSIGTHIDSPNWVTITPNNAEVSPVSSVVMRIVESEKPRFGQLAQRIANAGKMVVIALEASSIAEAITRLVDNGMSIDFAVNSVHLVALQTSLPTLCDDCAQPDDRESTNNHLAENTAWRRSMGDQTQRKTRRKGHGCPTCNNTGYTGQITLLEGIEVAECEKDVKKSIQRRDMVDVMSSINVQKRLWAASITYLVTGEIDSRDMEKNVQRTLFGK
ncbi:hypothetical protein B1757_13250 [Acidithiobacillus marinus]|uniref:Bacterial type II secretion system protein E domain-containing protein n=1 Tax=Acidithiobacillus marinus TaxID=187490 RepID=A0A2I1DIR5_9PROT|nr:hypothetical protein [Acidithiobacillus marinus]PKY09761.1 hypothetical protein B1757_13250 [Acidithiobacillus marinus]